MGHAAPLDILYCDDHLVAVNKPAGLPVHRSRLHNRQGVLLQQLRDQLGRWVYPVHRLDRPTSGVLVMGLTRAAAGKLAESFRTQRVQKRYIAVVRGFTSECGLIDHPISRPGRDAQSATTEYRRLGITELPVAVGRYATARYSLVDIMPRSGRMHQIRRHMAHIAHPVIGDTRYGDGRHNRLFRDRFGIHRLLLMATRIRLPHPGENRWVAVTAPPDPEFRRVTPLFQEPPRSSEDRPLESDSSHAEHHCGRIRF